MACASAADNITDIEVTQTDAVDAGNFSELNRAIAENDQLTLTKNYTYSPEGDVDFKKGIEITKDNYVIDGNGFTINGAGQARIFNIAADNVTLKNINFINGNCYEYYSGNGGAIYWNGNGGLVSGCSFADNYAYKGGAIYWKDSNNSMISNTRFERNDVSYFGGAVCLSGSDNLNFYNCSFDQNKGGYYGAAIYVGDEGKCFNTTVSGCRFTNSSGYSNIYGGAIFWKSGPNGVICNSTFIANTAYYGGAIQWGYRYNSQQSPNGRIYNCTFAANSASYGADIYWETSDNGEVFNCNFLNNTYGYYGGSIYWTQSVNGSVHDCSFKDYSGSQGGAIKWEYGDFSKDGSIYNCTFINIHVSGNAGAVYFHSDGGSITNCTFINVTGNNDHGGVIYMGGSGCILSGCRFINASSGAGGGAIWFVSRSGLITDCSFVNCNCSYDYGGAIRWDGDDGVLSNCIFINNTSPLYNGGALSWDNGNHATIFNCTFIGNRAEGQGGDYRGYGGAIFGRPENSLISQCTFIGNYAGWNGGGVSWTSSSNVTISNCTFENNSAKMSGGAINGLNSDGSVSNCIFINNTAGENGGAVNFNSVGIVNGSFFTYNTAVKGSAIYAATGVLRVENSIFLNNKAESLNLFLYNESLLRFYLLAGDWYVNAISADELEYSNVTYWNGTVANTDDTEIIIYCQGINITVEVYDCDNNLVDNFTAPANTYGDVFYNMYHLADGNYTLKAYHAEDAYYTYIETEGNFTLKRNSTLVEINMADRTEFLYVKNYNVTFGVVNRTNVRVIITDKAGNVVLNITPDGNNVTFTLLPDDGYYNLTVFNDGNESYAPGTDSKLFKILRVQAEAGDARYGLNDNYAYQAKLTDGAGNPISNATVTFKVNGQTCNATTDAEGIANFTFTAPVGTYDMTIESPYTESLTRTVSVVSRIVDAKDLTMDYDSGKFRVQVLGDDANPAEGVFIKMAVNGVTYNVKTDKNGYATLPIELRPKTYIITSTYKATTVKNTIKVKFTLKAKKTFKVKKTSKKLVLKATLKWSSGKAIVGKKIIIKFKGKKYTVKTNSKGIAKKVLTKKVIKKLKKGKTYKASINYKNETAITKIKVRR